MYNYIHVHVDYSLPQFQFPRIIIVIYSLCNELGWILQVHLVIHARVLTNHNNYFPIPDMWICTFIAKSLSYFRMKTAVFFLHESLLFVVMISGI